MDAEQVLLVRRSAPTKWKSTADTAAVLNYLYATRFRKPVEYPLRAVGSKEGRPLYTCPPGAVVYVLGQRAGPYTKVVVNGRLGYVASECLADIR